jgi:2-polyprenyl-6-hydroxyphenyl methylase / 3-demethylubiquinone-9 3-methyltransferase
LARTINNYIYDEFGEDWWNPNGHARLLHEMNPVRWRYFQDVLGGRDKIAGLRVLDVGCGGGLVSEEFAKAGAYVTGVDISESSLEIARRHATRQGLQIDYRHASAEFLPFEDNSFDIVVCCDFVEHISDKLDIFVTEMGRVLKPGGYFLYDTINRTFISRLIAIWALQDWLQIVPCETHVWRMLVKPAELEAALRRARITPRGNAGLAPAPLLPVAAYNILRHKKVGGFKLSPRFKPLSYTGHGIKDDL